VLSEDELNASYDPTLAADDVGNRDRQNAAIERLMGIGAAGGMDAQFVSQMEQAQRQADQRGRAQREASAQQMRARGMGGSGLAQLGMLTADQQTAQQRSQDALNLQAAAQQRALAATTAGGQMAGGARGQSNALSTFNSGLRTTASRDNAASGVRARAGEAEQRRSLRGQQLTAEQDRRQRQRNAAERRLGRAESKGSEVFDKLISAGTSGLSGILGIGVGRGGS
jgi:hypothetical protein